MLLLICGAGSVHAAGVRVPVLSITHDTVAQPAQEKVCWDVIVSDRELAQRQYQQQSWVVKYWKPILGGILGGALGYHFTANYGPTHQKWVYPTVAGGMAVGALAGPGAVLGGYALGTLAYAYVPGKLPVVAAVSLLGAILGDKAFDFLFPDKPSKDLLAPPQPGQYLVDQKFYVETSCLPRPVVRYTQSAYRVVYDYQGQRHTVSVPRFPGDTIELDANGKPMMLRPTPAQQVRVREIPQ
ncbi:hypothetical protein ACMHYJ_00480 [Castellaniella hirudinis]|uniref:hypothetical protein n=1 Tax=Castellaniella hirudinis TaxID=1144617 RepID=UPI0039C429F6